jgi:hypothetical protein
MTASIGAANSRSRPELTTTTYLRLRRMDFDDPDAANVTEIRNGIGATSQPSTVRDLSQLLFVRESCRSGQRRLAGADGRDRCDRTRMPAQPSSRRDDVGPPSNLVTLLTLFRSLAGPKATLDLLQPSARPRFEAAGDPTDRTGDAI